MRFRTVSCPTTNLCVAAGGLGGRVGVIRNPARRSSRWQVTRLGGAKTATGGYTSLSFSGLSCPNPRFCAAIDWRGRIVTTTRPAGGKRAWKVRQMKGFTGYVGAGNVDVSCPTTRFCAAIDGTGATAITRDGAATWTTAAGLRAPRDLDTGNGLVRERAALHRRRRGPHLDLHAVGCGWRRTATDTNAAKMSAQPQSCKTVGS